MPWWFTILCRFRCFQLHAYRPVAALTDIQFGARWGLALAMVALLCLSADDACDVDRHAINLSFHKHLLLGCLCFRLQR